MSLYAKYLKEREGLETLQNECGFVTYKMRGPDCYIQDIYVLPEHRKHGVAAGLADLVAEKAKAAGYKILTGSVDYRASSAEDSDKALRAYGMRPYTTEGQFTYYFKELT